MSMCYMQDDVQLHGGVLPQCTVAAKEVAYQVQKPHTIPQSKCMTVHQFNVLISAYANHQTLFLC
jgi:hypothetical protein